MVRAYGGAARDCLRAAAKTFKRDRVSFRLLLPYKVLGGLYGQLDKVGASRFGEEEYKEDGSVSIAISVDSDKEGDFLHLVSELTAGGVCPERLVN